MRPPWRAVGDDDVDRPQVGARRRVEPSGTNGPSASAQCARTTGTGAHRVESSLCPLSPLRSRPQRDKRRPLRGGAPLPIPNREVKPRRGDDTAGDRGKVARRPPVTESLHPARGAGFSVLCLFSFRQEFRCATQPACHPSLLQGYTTASRHCEGRSSPEHLFQF